MKFSPLFPIVSLVAALSFLGACEAPHLSSFEVNTFQNQSPVTLNVGAIEVVSEVQQFDRLPYINEKMPVTPEDALRSYVDNRFYAIDMSSPVTAVVTIQKAYMTQKDEDGENWYTLDNIAYKLSYALTLEYKDGDEVLYTQKVDGWESSSLPQRSSLADKEAVWQKMMNTMLQKTDRQLNGTLPERFAK